MERILIAFPMKKATWFDVVRETKTTITAAGNTFMKRTGYIKGKPLSQTMIVNPSSEYAKSLEITNKK